MDEYKDELITSVRLDLPLQERLALAFAITFGWSKIYIRLRMPFKEILGANGPPDWDFHTHSWWERAWLWAFPPSGMEHRP